MYVCVCVCMGVCGGVHNLAIKKSLTGQFVGLFYTESWEEEEGGGGGQFWAVRISAVSFARLAPSEQSIPEVSKD